MNSCLQDMEQTVTTTNIFIQKRILNAPVIAVSYQQLTNEGKNRSKHHKRISEQKKRREMQIQTKDVQK